MVHVIFHELMQWVLILALCLDVQAIVRSCNDPSEEAASVPTIIYLQHCGQGYTSESRWSFYRRAAKDWAGGEGVQSGVFLSCRPFPEPPAALHWAA